MMTVKSNGALITPVFSPKFQSQEMVMTLQFGRSDDEESFDKMRDFFNPSQVDNSVRQAMQMCWMMLPNDKRNVDELENQFRRIVDRAFKDMREDEQEFGIS